MLVIVLSDILNFRTLDTYMFVPLAQFALPNWAGFYICNSSIGEEP